MMPDMRIVASAARVAIGALAIVGSVQLTARAQTPEPVVLDFELTGVVDPFVADHVRDLIAEAQRRDVAAVLIEIDTPGGLSSSMREITEAILNSKVPVIGYVYPEGARAASAGTFILLSCPIAAMAPGTNVGAAHPVGLAGAVESEKATNDAAASIRAIADRYDRNADWAERAVRESVSASAEQALQLNVIDLIAPDVPSLLSEVDGTTVTVVGGQRVTLHTAGATLEPSELSLFASILHGFLDPNIAFVFFWFGLALLVLELFVPGGVAGTIGALMFVTSLVALGTLPVQLIGVALLVASVVFFVLELLHPGLGAPTIAGVVTLVLGGMFLFDRSGEVSVSPWVILPVAAFAILFFGYVVQQAVKTRRMRSTERSDRLVGSEALVTTGLTPVGVVRVASEDWTAESLAGTVAAGERVRVVGMKGLRLTVEPLERASATDAETDRSPPSAEERTEERAPSASAPEGGNP
jgi:membrane-bound serine protease (ClpP class)